MELLDLIHHHSFHPLVLLCVLDVVSVVLCVAGPYCPCDTLTHTPHPRHPHDFHHHQYCGGGQLHHVHSLLSLIASLPLCVVCLVFRCMQSTTRLPSVSHLHTCTAMYTQAHALCLMAAAAAAAEGLPARPPYSLHMHHIYTPQFLCIHYIHIHTHAQITTQTLTPPYRRLDTKQDRQADRHTHTYPPPAPDLHHLHAQNRRALFAACLPSTHFTHARTHTYMHTIHLPPSLSTYIQPQD